jgi:CelD/BcsL family acetyltransferase involved in cellulose biosynthesis
MFSVKNIGEENELNNLKATWNNLLKQSYADSPFLTWQWLYSWWQSYGQKYDLMILTLQQDQKLIAIAPLVYRTKSLGFLKIREIKFLGSSGVGSDYLDFILMKGAENTSIDTIFGYLARNEKKWDVINLTNIPDNSKSIDHVNKACKKLGYFNIVTTSYVCPTVQLPSTWDSYFSTLSKSMRYNIRRKYSKLHRSANIQYEVIREARDLDEAMQDLFRLNRLRMKAKNQRGAFLDKKFTQFHKNIISQFFQNGFLYLSFLKANNTRISVLYNFIYNNVCYYYQSGFDPLWAKFSPGTAIFSSSIRDAIDNGMVEYDFLRGDEAYKFKWANAKKKCVSIYIYNKTSIGLSLRWIFLLKDYIKKAFRQASHSTKT